MSNQYLKNLKNDIPAGIVVFFVAIPLCLGIALAYPVIYSIELRIELHANINLTIEIIYLTTLSQKIEF